MAEIFGWGASVFTADASGCDKEVSGAVEFASVGFDFEAFRNFADVIDAAVGAPSDACVAGGVGEAVDDGLGGVCDREHAAVVFDLKIDSVAFEPSDGIGWLKSVEGADEIFVTAWVICDEFAWVVAVVSDIAPSAS